MNIERLKELETKATPGPWKTNWSDENRQQIIDSIAKMMAKGDRAWHWVSFEGDTQHAIICETGNGPTSKANAEFIAAMRDVLLKFIAFLEAFDSWREHPDSQLFTIDSGWNELKLARKALGEIS